MADNFMELAKNRFSVRTFTDQAVEEDKLEKILEAGRIAPTAANLQPQRIYVLESKEAVAKMSSLSRCVYGAKTVLLFTYDSSEAISAICAKLDDELQRMKQQIEAMQKSDADDEADISAQVEKYQSAVSRIDELLAKVAD